MSNVVVRAILFLISICLVANELPAGNKWVPIGPAPISGSFSGGVAGRATVIAVNPHDGQQVWLGTAAGGVWFTPDGGQTWEPLSDKAPSLAIGAIEVADCDASGCDTLYVGTGENAIRRDTYYGEGLLVGTRVQSDPLTYSWLLRDGSPSYDFHGGSIVDIVLLPGTSGPETVIHIALSSGVTMSATEATVTAPEPSGGYGLYRSNDNGMTWSKVTVNASDGAIPTSLRIDPQTPSTLYAGFLGKGVFKSTNGGASWCPLNPGLDGGLTCAVSTGLPDPNEVEFDHVEVVPTLNLFQPGSPTYLYVSFGHCGDWLFDSCEPSLYKSFDEGATWILRRPGNPSPPVPYPPPCITTYSRFTHGLTVHPTDHNIIYMAGVTLCESGGSGAAMIEVDGNSVPGTGPSNYGNRIHLDHHSVVHDPTDWTHIYSTSDGGFAEQTTQTGFLKWTPRNEGLQTTGFQTIAVSPATSVVLGASQDNGGQKWAGGQSWDWVPCCGDGGYTAIALDDPMLMFAGRNRGGLARSTDGGTTWTPNQFDEGPSDWYKAFYAPFVQDPSPPHALYYGSNRLWKSVDDADDWTEVSPVMSHTDHPEIWREKDVISAIAVAPSDPNRIYIGYYGGSLFTTSSPSPDCDDPQPPAPLCSDPADWDLVSQSLPDAPVTGIAVSPIDPLKAWVTFSGFGNFPRVWETTTGGGSWTATVAGLPAGVPANTIAVDYTAPDALLLGLDSNPTGATLWRGSGGGTTWLNHSTELPNSPVISIAVDASRSRVYVATHGRGAFVRGVSFPLLKEAWVAGLLWDIPLWGWELEPDVDCTIQLLREDASTCADSPVDALGGQLRTDSDGRLVSSLAGRFDAMPLVWACFGGQCAGGVDISSCETLDAVQVSCGTDAASSTLQGVQLITDPPSALLRTAMADVAANEGVASTAEFDLVASLHSGDGTTRSLCTVDMIAQAGELPSDVATRAADAVNASETCEGAGVRADLVGGESSGGEDEFGLGPWLKLETPGTAGTQFVPAVHAAPGAATGRCFELRSLGLPARNQLHVLSLTFEAASSGAAGGEITVVETTGLGTCAIIVPTDAGQAPDDVAGSVADAFQAAGIPGPHAHCPSRRNPRDVTADNDTVHTVVASILEVCVDDPGLGFSLKSEDLGNVHPVAICSDTVTECTGPDGAGVTVDGSASRDPDSTPGTNDDLTAHEWYSGYGSASQVLLGTGPQIDLDLSLGSHDVTLLVRDAAGLESVRTCTATVVDTTPPDLSATLAPTLLWPPNHRMVEVVADVQTSDVCSAPVLELSSLESDEPDDAPGPDDGETAQDVQTIGEDRRFLMRAERDRRAAGRSYSAHYRSTDGSGNVATIQPVVVVPLDVGGVVEPILLMAAETPAGTRFDWTPVSDASGYNVISGEQPNIMDSGTAYDVGPVICIEASSPDATTAGNEDNRTPSPGRPYFYLAEYVDAAGVTTGYGTETAAKPRTPSAGSGCP